MTDKNKYDAAIALINNQATAELQKSDKKFAADLKKAKDFLDKNYNKFAEAGDKKNEQTLTQYKQLVKIATRNADERDVSQNKKQMNLVDVVLEKTAGNNK